MKQTPRESEPTSIWSFFTREFDEPTKEAKQMTAETPTAGATSHQEVNWHAIDWQAVNQEVKRLQVRIVKAQQQGKWGKVKALQHLLTHSFSGKALAVKRVTENQGKRTPGVDGEIWNTPQKKAKAVETLTQRGYRPRPLKRIYIPKSNGGKRPLSIPTMKDRAMQALYLLALDPIAETLADPNSYGFRKERGPADAIDQCHTVLSNRAGAEWILEGDIKACFDKISHTWLEAHIPMDKSILRKWLKAGYREKRVLSPTVEGTPQGGICSPVIANLALDGLEAKLREKYPKASYASRKAKANLVRFARVTRGGNPTTCGTIYEGERSGTVSGKDPHHAYYRSFRFLRSEHTQVQGRKSPRKTFQEERQDVSHQDPKTHQGKCPSDSRTPDSTT